MLASKRTKASIFAIHARASHLTEGSNVYLRGFGSFIIKDRAAKTARNISKNTTMIIPAHSIPSFKPANEFVEQVKKQVK